MITVAVCIVAAMALCGLGVVVCAGKAADRQIREGERIADALSRYDYRSNTFSLSEVAFDYLAEPL